MRCRAMIVLSFLVVFMSLTACKSNEVDKNKSFTFSVLYNENRSNFFQEDWPILEEYKRRKNVTLDVHLGDNENFEEAIRLHFNSESPPDVILKCWPDTIASYASEGLVLPISDYVDSMPYYKAYIENHNLQLEVQNLTAANGKYYILPGYQRETQVQQWIYRKDIFEKHNLAMPTTYHEMYDSLSLLKDIYPESTPITASWGGAHLLSMIGANYGIPAGWSGTRFFDEDSNNWRYAPASDVYREMHRFLNKSYIGGILDPALFTQTNDEFIEKLLNGDAFVTVTWISSGFDSWNTQLEENGVQNGEWVPLPVMESTVGISKLPPVNRFRKGLAISSSAAEKPYFEEMLSFLDWAIYSNEGIDLTYWGIEGLTYETTSNGKQFLPAIITPNNPNGSITLENYGFNTLFNLNEDEEFEDNKKPDNIVTFLHNSEVANDTLPSDPKLVLEDDAIEMIEIINVDLSTYVDSASKKFIIGELDIEEDWENYIGRLRELGYQTIENIWNIAWLEEQD